MPSTSAFCLWALLLRMSSTSDFGLWHHSSSSPLFRINPFAAFSVSVCRSRGLQPRLEGPIEAAGAVVVRSWNSPFVRRESLFNVVEGMRRV